MPRLGIPANDQRTDNSIGIGWPQGWWQKPTDRIQQEIAPSDWMAQAVYNQMLRWLDPYSQRETMQYLYSENPRGYQKYEPVRLSGYEQNSQTYGPVAPLSRDAAQTSIQPARIANMLKAASYDEVAKNFSTKMQEWLRGERHYSTQPLQGDKDKGLGKEEGVRTQQGLKSSLGWLRSALDTAAMAAGPDATRQDQLTAAAHLDTLFKQADQDELTAGRFKTLFENLVNPVTDRAPLTGILGQQRIANPRTDSYRRGGVAYRNYATL